MYKTIEDYKNEDLDLGWLEELIEQVLENETEKSFIEKKIEELDEKINSQLEDLKYADENFCKANNNMQNIEEEYVKIKEEYGEQEDIYNALDYEERTDELYEEIEELAGEVRFIKSRYDEVGEQEEWACSDYNDEMYKLAKLEAEKKMYVKILEKIS